MKKYNDNILDGVQNWSAPYRFVIGRKSRWDDSVEIMLWTPEPAIAYIAYVQLIEESEVSNDSFLYDYFLHDSFHKDAERFCQLAFESESGEELEFL